VTQPTGPGAYRWLGIGAVVALALAAFLAVVAVRRAGEDHRRANDIGARAEQVMDRIEAETNRLENASR
jgi:type VI protein secretion system component VasK